jgi:general secretion pathway protein K
MSPVRNERGAALIMALLVVALATLLSTRLLLTTDLSISLIEGRSARAQGIELTRGGVDYARAILFDDARRSSIDHFGEAWSTPLPPVEAPAGEGNARISGRIEDLQGRWNINNLIASNGQIDPVALAILQRLLRELGLDAVLATRVATRLMPPPAFEDGTPVPQPLLDLGELLDLPGFDVAILERMQPFLCALPDLQPTNVNTAPDLVLVALVPGLDRAGAQALVRRRERLPFREIGEFRGELSSPQRDATQNLPLTVASRHFLIHANAMVERAVVRQRALVQRRGDGRWPAVIWRTYS